MSIGVPVTPTPKPDEHMNGDASDRQRCRNGVQTAPQPMGRLVSVGGLDRSLVQAFAAAVSTARTSASNRQLALSELLTRHVCSARSNSRLACSCSTPAGTSSDA